MDDVAGEGSGVVRQQETLRMEGVDGQAADEKVGSTGEESEGGGGEEGKLVAKATSLRVRWWMGWMREETSKWKGSVEVERLRRIGRSVEAREREGA